MLTHVDLMKFNSMVRHIGNCQAEVYELFDHVRACWKPAFRWHHTDRCLPYPVEAAAFNRQQKKSFCNCREGYHPLIEKPVANSVRTEKDRTADRLQRFR